MYPTTGPAILSKGLKVKLSTVGDMDVVTVLALIFLT